MGKVETVRSPWPGLSSRHLVLAEIYARRIFDTLHPVHSDAAGLSLPDIPGLLLVDIPSDFFPEIQQVFMGDARRNYPCLLQPLFQLFQQYYRGYFKLIICSVFQDTLSLRLFCNFKQLFKVEFPVINISSIMQ